MLTVPQAAQLLGISPAAIYAAIAQKRLPRRYRQGSLVVREADVLAWDSTKKKRGRSQGQPISPQHRSRISEGQKQRWARHREDKSAPDKGNG